MNVERLQHLITVLENVEKEQKAFSMKVWFSEHCHAYSYVGNPENSCGTMACALGYAAQDEEFKNQGLNVDIKGNSFYEHTVTYNNKIGIWAACDFLKLIFFPQNIYLCQKDMLVNMYLPMM